MFSPGGNQTWLTWREPDLAHLKGTRPGSPEGNQTWLTWRKPDRSSPEATPGPRFLAVFDRLVQTKVLLSLHSFAKTPSYQKNRSTVRLSIVGREGGAGSG